MSSNVSWLPRRYRIWWKYQTYPSVASYRAIQSFDHPASRICSWVWIHVKLKHIFFSILHLIVDNLYERLETLSNLHTALAKVFSSYHKMRIHGMSSPLTRSDRFHVDLLTTFIHNPPYPDHPVHDLIIMIGYEPIHGFICTRFHGGLRSKDHLLYSHLENHLLTFK